MKTKQMKTVLGIIMAASLELSGIAAMTPAAVYAEETESEVKTELLETEEAERDTEEQPEAEEKENGAEERPEAEEKESKAEEQLEMEEKESGAEEQPEMEETESEEQSETEEETEKVKEPQPDVKLMAGDTEIVLKNETGIPVEEAFLAAEPDAEGVQETEQPEGDEDVTGTETPAAAENTSETGNAAETEGETEVAEKNCLIVIEESGTRHVIEDVYLLDMAEPCLTEENGFIYLRYLNENGEEKRAAETADEKAFEKPVKMYVLNDVYIRAAADGESEILGVAELGSEITAIGATPKWYRVEQGEIDGYVAGSYLSRDKESADQAVKAEEAEIARVQAEAAAAAQAAAQAQAAARQKSKGSGKSGSKGKTEVSRQRYDDCDGSGHGYYEITYSDGSTAIQEY